MTRNFTCWYLTFMQIGTITSQKIIVHLGGTSMHNFGNAKRKRMICQKCASDLLVSICETRLWLHFLKCLDSMSRNISKLLKSSPFVVVQCAFVPRYVPIHSTHEISSSYLAWFRLKIWMIHFQRISNMRKKTHEIECRALTKMSFIKTAVRGLYGLHSKINHWR